MGNSESTQIRIDTNEFECIQTDDNIVTDKVEDDVAEKILEWTNKTCDSDCSKSDSECSKSDSDCSKSDSECSKSDSECSKSDSECSKSDSECSKSDSECSKSDRECIKSDSECSKSDRECIKSDSECMVYNHSKQIKTTVTSSSDFVYCILNDTTPVGYLNGNISLENVYQTMKYYAHRVIGNMTKIDPTTQMYMYMTPTGVRITNVQNFLVQYERIYTIIRYVKIPKIGIKLKL